MASLPAPKTTTVADAFKEAWALVKKIKPDKVPLPEEGRTPLPLPRPEPAAPGDKKKSKTGVEGGPGVLTFDDAVDAVDEVLGEGIFAKMPDRKAGESLGRYAERVGERMFEKMQDVSFGADLDTKAERIVELMRKRVLSQKHPRKTMTVKIRRRL